MIFQKISRYERWRAFRRHTSSVGLVTLTMINERPVFTNDDQTTVSVVPVVPNYIPQNSQISNGPPKYDDLFPENR